MYSTPRTHKAVGLSSPTSGLVELDIPTLNPGKGQVLVRVFWSTFSPGDLWNLDLRVLVKSYPYVLGQSLSGEAGEVVEVGEGVTDVAVGDRVFSCTTYNSGPEGRAFQEYALLDQRLVGKVPSNIKLEESSTVPDALLSILNFGALKLYQPRSTDYPITTPPVDRDAPFVLWGASGGVGQYALQLLRILGYTNIIAVASSKHHELLRSLGAAATVDYMASDASEKIVKACGGPPKYAFDTIGDEEYSLKPILKVIGPQTKFAYFVPVRVGPPGEVSEVMLKPSFEFPGGVEAICVATSYDFEKVPRWEEWHSKTMPVLLQSGMLQPIRYREVTGSSLLERADAALDLLRRAESD